MTHVQKETALLLKEKRFDVPCEGCYGVNSDELHVYPHAVYPNKRNIPAPTLYEATEWLRAKGLHVSVAPVNLWQQWRMFIYLNSYPPQKTRIPDKPMDYQTHDLALEAGIVHALKNYVK